MTMSQFGIGTVLQAPGNGSAAVTLSFSLVCGGEYRASSARDRKPQRHVVR